jgi:hypothetical protein
MYAVETAKEHMSTTWQQDATVCSSSRERHYSEETVKGALGVRAIPEYQFGQLSKRNRSPHDPCSNLLVLSRFRKQRIGFVAKGITVGAGTQCSTSESASKIRNDLSCAHHVFIG